MKPQQFSRREFLQRSAVLAGAAVSTPLLTHAAAKRTAVDQVVLGQTGIKTSRLGMGTGSNSGRVQFDLGKEQFIRLVRYAYDQGITYFDSAQSYATFDWMGDAIKGLPREKLFIQSKIPGKPENVAEVIERHRRTFNTDYIDSLLIHCMVKSDWTDDYKRIRDAFDEAKQKGLIRAKGVSCHTLPALRAAARSDWNQVHLVRVNPQAKHIDGMTEAWNQPGNELAPVLTEIQSMHAQGRGVIGMKIIGNGDFTNAEDREKSIRFAMSRPEIDAVVIGVKSTQEIDEAISRINAALS